MEEKELIEIFSRAGLYEKFDCKECRDRDVFVSGPHSHVCADCGERAYYHFYQTPRCVDCFKRWQATVNR